MDHIGIDLGSKDSQVCIRNSAGEIVGEYRSRTDKLITLLQDRSPARVIVETCTEAFRVAALAQRAGHDVRVVAATLVRSLGVGQRGLKNDVRDARVLSEASCRMDLPSVHIPTAISQEVKAICVSRGADQDADAAHWTRSSVRASSPGPCSSGHARELAEAGTPRVTRGFRRLARASRARTRRLGVRERTDCRRR